MMYSFSVTNQLIVFLQSLGFGVIMGISENILFFLAGFITLNEKIRYIISDSILFLFLVFSLFCFVISYNLGTVRLYIVSGALFGVLIYELSFGDVMRFISEKLLRVLKKLFSFVFMPFSRLKKGAKEKIGLKSNKTHKKSNKCIAKKNNDVV